jgi:hypothetical protein
MEQLELHMEIAKKAMNTYDRWMYLSAMLNDPMFRNCAPIVLIEETEVQFGILEQIVCMRRFEEWI